MKLFICNIHNLTKDDYIKWFNYMNTDKQNRVKRFRLANDKMRTIAGEMLARKAIGEYCNVSPANIIFNVKNSGKPYAVDLNIEFNISHSGDMVVCVVNEKSIGIDIEKIRPIDLSVSKHIFTKNELVYLFGKEPVSSNFKITPNKTILRRFFEIWTRKEAISKCIECGIGKLNYNQLPNNLKEYTQNIYEDYQLSIVYKYIR